MRRGAFLALAAAPLLHPSRAHAQNEFDPASSSAHPALRVLLGPGDTSPSPEGFTFEGRPYRGRRERLDDGRIVNVVDLEQYLYGVIPGEMSPHWPAAALQAQAICARTYVLQRSDPRREYDLVPSELDQLYHGIEGESPAATAAVDATAGRVLHFGDAFARIAYSSCCGGHTAAAADAWGGPPIPYLAGVLCNWCSESPNFRWTARLTLDAIAAACTVWLATLGELEDLRVAQRDSSGRARTFELLAQNGGVTIAGSTFRRAVGPRTLRSLLVTRLQRLPDQRSIAIEGGGLGHGVGLCQWGARGLALTGVSATEILTAYFPGTLTTNLG